MLSLGIGLQQLASRRLMKSGLFDTVVVTSRRDLRNFGHNEDRNGPAPGESRILDEPTRLEIEHLPNVLEAYPDIRFITELRYEDKRHLTMIAALPSSAKSNDAFRCAAGSLLFVRHGGRGRYSKSICGRTIGGRRQRLESTKLTWRNWLLRFWAKS